jgi:pSer/pThr/pTyr-binding forkhead associated (FHA) protein
MRLRAVAGAEPTEAVHESDHVLTKSDLATVEALRPGTALLVVLRGPNTGARFLLDDDEVMSGRHPESDIFLDDVTVSRKHAIFRRTESGFVVRDVGSLNGTYVNRELVEEVVLKTGDEVQIGKFRLVFYASQAAASR